MSYQKWHTLLELKDNHPKLGMKGSVYFIVDFLQDIESDEIQFMIASPCYSGGGVGVGLFSYGATQEKIMGYFTVMEKTFKDYALELEERFYTEA